MDERRSEGEGLSDGGLQTRVGGRAASDDEAWAVRGELRLLPEVPVAADGVMDSVVGESVAAIIESIICSYAWDCATALGIVYGNATCPNGESGGDPHAVSADRADWGLFQINEATWRPYFGEERWSRVLEVEENVKMAYEIYQRAGNTWQPWSCRP